MTDGDADIGDNIVIADDDGTNLGDLGPMPHTTSVLQSQNQGSVELKDLEA
jgi:hypothetical protein